VSVPGVTDSSVPPSVNDSVAPRSGLTERLQEIEQLRAKGLVSDEEYATKHRRIIDEA
jgi:hypothetical protein